MSQGACKIAQSITPKHLELIILPTEKCNFRCTYCYEDFAIGKMKPEIVSGIKQLIQKRLDAGLSSLKLAWFGGEPLLAKDILLDLSNYATTLASQHPALHYHGSMTTNGYLLDLDTLTQLVQLGLREFQISLDGTKTIHDETRRVANGQGSFEKIWQHLLAAKASTLNFEITLRLHVTTKNHDALSELIALINTSFAGDSRFRVFLKAIENLGGPNAGAIETLNNHERTVQMNKLYELIDPKIKVEKLASRKPYICYAAQANSFLIRANGRVGKCTVALNDEKNDIGCITPEGDLCIDNTKLAPWVRGLGTQHPGELACPMMGL